MSIKRVCAGLLIVLLAVVLCVGCGTPAATSSTGAGFGSSPTRVLAAATPQSASAGQPTPQTSNGDGLLDVTILLTNDVHGKTDPCG